MVLWGCLPPRGVPLGFLRPSGGARHRRAGSSTSQRSPGWPSTTTRTPPHQGEGLLPQRVRDRAPVPVPWPALLRPPCRPPSLPLRLRRQCRAPSPLRRGHPRRLCPRPGGGLMVLVSWGFGGDELAGVRVDVVEVVVVVVVVVVGVVCRHLLDAGGMHLTGCTSGCGGAPPPAPLLSPRPPPWAPMPRPACPLGPAAPLPLPLGPFPAPCPCRGSRLPSPTPWPARSPTSPRPAPCTWAPFPCPCAPFPCPGAFPAPCVVRSAPPRCCALPGPLAGRPAAFAAAAA